jgi:hypothetical protein
LACYGLAVISLLAISAALAVEPNLESPEPATVENVLMVNPLGPALALAANAIVIGDIGIRVRAFDLNLRAHHVFTDRWGLTAQLDFTTAELLVRGTHLGVRAGPRMAVRKRGLTDWTLSPFLMAGYTALGTLSFRMAGWGMVGFGGEVGRTWIWRRLSFELGLGLYSTTNFGYASQVETLVGSEAPNLGLPLKPLLNACIGYAF